VRADQSAELDFLRACGLSCRPSSNACCGSLEAEPSAAPCVAVDAKPSTRMGVMSGLHALLIFPFMSGIILNFYFEDSRKFCFHQNGALSQSGVWIESEKYGLAAKCISVLRLLS
jgi:hypothetical protein